jgi:hypothetical protein
MSPRPSIIGDKESAIVGAALITRLKHLDHVGRQRYDSGGPFKFSGVEAGYLNLERLAE